MAEKRYRTEYSETTDSRTFHIIHIKCVTGCCLNCAKRHRRDYYHLGYGIYHKRPKLPNWKLVSKNKKQWMKKPLKLRANKYTHVELKW